MAIGELQRELGPDSRISAPHDAGGTSSGGQPHWTAVYDAWKRPEDPNTPETPQSRNPTFRAWLASGANQATGGPAGTADKTMLVSPNSLGANAAAAGSSERPDARRQRGKPAGTDRLVDFR